MSLSLMNLDAKILLIRLEDYVIQQLMELKIKIDLKKMVKDTELMELVYKELTANLQYFSIKKTMPIISC